MSISNLKWMVLVLAAAGSPLLPCGIAPGVAEAAPAGRYRAGMRVRAKQTCTVQGYEVKKGVVLGVVAVRSDDKGKTVAVDLSFSGMTIGNVPTSIVDSLFAPA
jgi:hypothetical protein